MKDLERDSFRYHLGQVLKELRENLGHSQGFVCKQLGRSTSWLSMIENGKTTTTLDVLNIILNIYGVSFLHFFESIELRNQSKDSNESIVESIVVIKKNERHPLIIYGLSYLLPYRKQQEFVRKNRIDFVPVILLANRKSAILQHAGEEYWYVVEGVLTVYFYKADDDLLMSQTISKDDAVHFNSSIKHQAVNQTKQPVKFVTVRLPKIF